jgi:hypothetical protein
VSHSTDFRQESDSTPQFDRKNLPVSPSSISILKLVARLEGAEKGLVINDSVRLPMTMPVSLAINRSTVPPQLTRHCDCRAGKSPAGFGPTSCRRAVLKKQKPSSNFKNAVLFIPLRRESLLNIATFQGWEPAFLQTKVERF